MTVAGRQRERDDNYNAAALTGVYGRSLAALGLTVIGWLLIVTLPVDVVIRTFFQPGASSDLTLTVSGLVALPVAGLYWGLGKSLRQLGDYIFSLVAFQVVFAIVAMVGVVTFDIELITGTGPSAVASSGMLCVVSLSAYYRTYGGGLVQSVRAATARFE
jgi:hypothetical protein